MGLRLVRQLAVAALAPLFSGAVLAEDVVIVGSGNPEYVVGKVAAAFNARFPQHRASVPPSTGSAGAIRDVDAGKALLGRLGRLLRDEERAKGLVYLPIGRDPVAFVAGGRGDGGARDSRADDRCL